MLVIKNITIVTNPQVAHNAIFAMGIVGSGTNNARLANMLRQLAQYYHKDANNLFMVRLAQGLVHLGKGTLTLSPYHSDRMLMSRVAVGGLLGVIVAFMDVNNLIIGTSSQDLKLNWNIAKNAPSYYGIKLPK